MGISTNLISDLYFCANSFIKPPLSSSGQSLCIHLCLLESFNYTKPTYNKSFTNATWTTQHWPVVGLYSILQAIDIVFGLLPIQVDKLGTCLYEKDWGFHSYSNGRKIQFGRLVIERDTITIALWVEYSIEPRYWNKIIASPPPDSKSGKRYKSLECM